MHSTENKGLELIEHELRFIARESQRIEGCYDTIDEINYAVVSALRALEEHRLSLGRECEEPQSGDVLAA